MNVTWTSTKCDSNVMQHKSKAWISSMSTKGENVSCGVTLTICQGQCQSAVRLATQSHTHTHIQTHVHTHTHTHTHTQRHFCHTTKAGVIVSHSLPRLSGTAVTTTVSSFIAISVSNRLPGYGYTSKVAQTCTLRNENHISVSLSLHPDLRAIEMFGCTYALVSEEWPSCQPLI